jgi:hypothetical protein
MAAKSKTKPTANGVPTPPGDVLTLAEAAAFLRVPEAGLRQDAEAGEVPGRRIAGEWRFGRAALLTWLSGAETPNEARKKSMLAVAGSFADDETLMPMVEEIYRERKRNPVGG